MGDDFSPKLMLSETQLLYMRHKPKKCPQDYKKMASNGAVEESNIPLLENSPSTILSRYQDDGQDQDLVWRVWIESKKLWHIVGPSIFSRLASYSMIAITQAFAGHLGDLELAAISIAYNVILGFDFGLLLGMASALETLCGQAFGAKKYNMLGVYMQRSWIVLLMCCVLVLPLFVFASPILKLMGQPSNVAELTGVVAIWIIPLHFSFAFVFPLQRFLQSQVKTGVLAWVSLVALVVHAIVSWLFVNGFKLGVVGTAITLSFSWWVLAFGLFGFTVCGGCPLTWSGFSIEAFFGLWNFIKLSAASGVMLCLENWYYRVLILITGNLKNAEIVLDAMSICMTIIGWQMMIPLAFFAGAGVRVANELGAGNGKGAKFATMVSVGTSLLIGLFFWLLIMNFNNKIALIFSSSQPVLKMVNKLTVLLAFTILLNSVQLVLSGVAVGSGWQSYVAYINLGCYYLIGVRSFFFLIGVAVGSGWQSYVAYINLGCYYLIGVRSFFFLIGVAVGSGWQSYVAYINLGCYYLIGVPLGYLLGWGFEQGIMGVWAGMIFAGTGIQTLILAIITIRCNWEKEAERASMHVKRWSGTNN